MTVTSLFIDMSGNTPFLSGSSLLSPSFYECQTDFPWHRLDYLTLVLKNLNDSWFSLEKCPIFSVIWKMFSWFDSAKLNRPFFFFTWINLFNCRLIALQCCGGFCDTSTWINHRCSCVPPSWIPSHQPPLPILLGCTRALALCALLQALKLPWSWGRKESDATELNWTELNWIYAFQCYSLRSSHPHLLPHSPKVCSLHLSLCWLCIDLSFSLPVLHFML